MNKTTWWDVDHSGPYPDSLCKVYSKFPSFKKPWSSWCFHISQWLHSVLPEQINENISSLLHLLGTWFTLHLQITVGAKLVSAACISCLELTVARNLLQRLESLWLDSANTLNEKMYLFAITKYRAKSLLQDSNDTRSQSTSIYHKWDTSKTLKDTIGLDFFYSLQSINVLILQVSFNRDEETDSER